MASTAPPQIHGRLCYLNTVLSATELSHGLHILLSIHGELLLITEPVCPSCSQILLVSRHPEFLHVHNDFPPLVFLSLWNTQD